ncbi:hypothetical protein, partial [Faecalibaculum rodentium]|uniref:hypothetical protein n=1 Tax=Faecalibaculum rodentium TaxID=1702221 RepID=UPI0025AF9E4E
PTSRNCGFRQRREPQFRAFVGTKALLATMVIPDFTFILQYLSFEFYTPAVFFSRTPKVERREFEHEKICKSYAGCCASPVGYGGMFTENVRHRHH